jgi:hypothetical protein
MKLKIKSLILMLALLPSLVLARTDNEFVNWNYIDVTVPLKFISPKLFLTESISPRIKNEWRDMDVVVLRSQLGYKANENLITSLGYDWRRRFNTDSNYENRIWQQLEYEKHFGRHELGARLRFEQRMIENQDAKLRLRPRLAYSYQLTNRTAIEISDELLFSFIGRDGFEQNRILLSLNNKINDNLNFNIGYQLQHYFQGRNQINHALVTRLEIFL